MMCQPIGNGHLEEAIMALLKFMEYRCEKSAKSYYSAKRNSMIVKDNDALFYKFVCLAFEYKCYETACKAFIWEICKVTSFRQFNIIKKLIKKIVQYGTSLSNHMKELKHELKKNRNRSCS